VNSFSGQLAATRANLEKLERLAAECPDLVAHWHNGIYVQDDRVRLIIGDSKKTPEYWRKLAMKYRAANWRREVGSNHWDGELNGVMLTILDAQGPSRHEKEAVFAESEAP
jgi:hypothetical protein